MIPVAPEPSPDHPAVERCVFCRQKTKFWTSAATRLPGDQVPCCQDCAAAASPEDIPSKRVWMRREKIAEWKLYGLGEMPAPNIDEIASYPPRKEVTMKTQPLVRARDPEERERIVNLATAMVATQVAKGEVDPDNEEQLRAAMKEAVPLAAAAYRAAVEFICG